MKVHVLRDCYVFDRLWGGGTIADIPEGTDLEKNAKNFRLVEPEKADVPDDEQDATEQAYSEPEDDSTEDYDANLGSGVTMVKPEEEDAPAKPRQKRKTKRKRKVIKE